MPERLRPNRQPTVSAYTTAAGFDTFSELWPVVAGRDGWVAVAWRTGGVGKRFGERFPSLPLFERQIAFFSRSSASRRVNSIHEHSQNGV